MRFVFRAARFARPMRINARNPLIFSLSNGRMRAQSMPDHVLMRALQHPAVD